MSKKTYALIIILTALLTMCKKQDAITEVSDQPISVSITVDGKTSVETAVR